MAAAQGIHGTIAWVAGAFAEVRSGGRVAFATSPPEEDESMMPLEIAAEWDRFGGATLYSVCDAVGGLQGSYNPFMRRPAVARAEVRVSVVEEGGSMIAEGKGGGERERRRAEKAGGEKARGKGGQQRREGK